MSRQSTCKTFDVDVDDADVRLSDLQLDGLLPGLQLTG